MKQKINVFEVTQPIGSFYIGKMSLSLLKRFAIVKTHEKNNFGIQRKLKPKRVPQIARYCEDPDATFPTPIILSMDSSTCSFKKVENIPSLIQLEFDDEIAKGEILDGQHRFEGMKSLQSFDIELPVVVMFDLKLSEKAYVFSTINSNQVKVDRSLIYELFGYSNERSPQQTCHEIARIMNSEESSPFYLKLKMIGIRSVDSESLSQGTFIKYLMKHITDNENDDLISIKREEKLEMNEKFIFREFFIEKKDEYILKIMENFFSAIKEVFLEEWSNSDTYILGKTTGYGALMKVLPVLYKKGLEKKDITKEFFKEYFLKVKNKMHLEKITFTSEHFPSGEAGQKKLRDYILSKMGICPCCELWLKDAQFNKARTLKSCPCCSDKMGKHVFYRCPEEFGVAPSRANESNPMGLQSYCIYCRGNKDIPHDEYVLCDKL